MHANYFWGAIILKPISVLWMCFSDADRYHVAISTIIIYIAILYIAVVIWLYPARYLHMH